jgi:Predicted membrane protein (DUF2207)
MVTALAIAGSLVGWIILLRAFTAGPRLGRAARNPGVIPTPPAPPPAVVGLVAGRPDADLLTVTLLDLAARGWFRLTDSLRGPQALDPAMCVLPEETPVENLTPYELRAITHLSHRAGGLPEVPAAAVADGFKEGADSFREAFRDDVIADARRLRLTRPTLSAVRKAVLCLLALVPPGVALIAAYPHMHGGDGQVIGLCAFYYVILCVVAGQISSERLTPEGQQALAAWQAHIAAPGSAAVAAIGTREAAHAAALGVNLGALALFTPPGQKTIWSGYGERWRLIRIGDAEERIWPGISGWTLAAFCLLFAPGIPLLAFGGYEFVGGSRGVELGIVTGMALDALVLIRGMSRWSHLPRHAEFDGMVLRRWDVDGGDEASSYYVAVDDGFRTQAWAFEVRATVYHRLTPGSIVHVRTNERLNKVIGIEVIRPPTATPMIADPARPADPRSASG